MQGEIVAQGVELMLYGMGTVVIFLALLVLITAGMSSAITRYFPVADAPQRVAASPARDEPIAGLDPELVAVVTAAIHQHRAQASRSTDD